jgi:trans-2,3-dihydro-3-hydroxyanthranilate isomerase
MIRYTLLDVFTTRRYAGNPLAVVADGATLDAATMQHVARELNLSETTFVFPTTAPGATHRVRIFTPGAEVPFAGHPTIGTALHLAARDHPDADAVNLVFEEEIGLVHVAVRGRGPDRTAELTVAQLPQHRPAPDVAAMASALALTPAQVLGGAHAPATWSCGLPFTFVAVPNLTALAEARPLFPGWHAGLTPTPEPMVMIYTTATGDPEVDVRARMFAPEVGVVEDPATGSAVSALAGALFAAECEAGVGPDGVRRWTVHQGVEMGRPSILALSATIVEGKLAEVRVRGHAVTIGEGTLYP